MNDRERLELAAKAAGMKLWRDPETDSDYWGDAASNYICSQWNPRTDHGDRYRLARDCKMQIDFSRGIVLWGDRGTRWSGIRRFTPGNDAEEADAVINAAAEIGRNMK